VTSRSSAPARRRATGLVGRFTLAVVGAALAVAAVPAAPASAASALPTDPAARGYIGLCDQAGHNVSGGSVDTTPFAWKAVASTKPPAAYQGNGENAALEIYQPRPGVPAAEWSGAQVTAASFYSTPAHPAVQATYADQSLRDFMHDYPPMVDGLFQLRMTYGKAGYGLYGEYYPATIIQVVGQRWHVVSGGTVDCAAAEGVSNEQRTGSLGAAKTTPRRPAAGEQLVTGSAARTPGPYSQAEASAASGDGVGSTGGTSTWLIVWSVLASVVAIAALVFAVVRRRPPSRPDPS
jgi:hypothetical protein